MSGAVQVKLRTRQIQRIITPRRMLKIGFGHVNLDFSVHLAGVHTISTPPKGFILIVK